MKGYLNKFHYIWSISCFVLISILVLFSLNSPFVSDDIINIIQFDFNHTPKLNDFFGTGWSPQGPTWAYRPLLTFTYYLNYLISGTDPSSFRIVNAIIHFTNAILILILAFRKKKFDGKNQILVFLVITLFIFSPVVWHSVIYVSARSTLLVTFFILLSFLIYSIEGKWKNLFVFPAICAVLVKETGLLVFPLLMLFHTKILKEEIKKIMSMKIQIKFLIISIFVIATFFSFFYRREVFWGLSENYENFSELYQHWVFYVITQFKLFLNYLALVFFPFTNWAFFHDMRLVSSIDFPFAPFLLMFLLLLSTLLFVGLYKKFRGASVYLFCFFLSFSPEFFYPREILFNEQRLYLPIVFLVFYFIFSFDSINKHLMRFLIVYLVLSYLTCFFRTQSYSSLDKILTHDLKIYPKHLFVLPMLGDKALEMNDLHQAKIYFTKSFESFYEVDKFSAFSKKEFFKTILRLVQVNLALGNIDESNDLVSKCLSFGKFNEIYCALLKSMILNNQRQFSETIALYERQNQFLPLLSLEYFIALCKSGEFIKALNLSSQIEIYFSADARFQEALKVVHDGVSGKK